MNVEQSGMKSRKSALMLAAAVAGLGLFSPQAKAEVLDWSATPATSNWSNPANWATSIAPKAGDSLVFWDSTILSPVNDLPANTLITGITFNGTSSFLITGNTINFGGEIVNNGGSLQTINLNINGSGAPITITASQGTIRLGGALTGTQNLVKNEAGTLQLTGVGASTFGGQLISHNGRVEITGRFTNTAAINMGATGGSTAVLRLDGGTISTTDVNLATVDGAQAYMRITNGVVTNTGNINIAGNSNSAVGGTRYAALTLNGGTINTGGYFVVGFNNNYAIYTQTAGVVNLTGSPRILTIGAGGANSYGVANISGGEFHVYNGDGARGIRIGENGSGILTISGNAFLTTPGGGNTAARGTIIAQASRTDGSLFGVLNLNGGTLVSYIDKSAGRGDLNFNGGVLIANRTGSLLAGFVPAAVNGGDMWVRNGGAILDDNGYAVTVANGLQAPTGNGLAIGTMGVSGSNYVEAPLVQITGGGGYGATAVAEIDSNGALVGITITNPGTGYVGTPTVSLQGGGGGGSVFGTPELKPNVSTGGLTKRGFGTVTLQGANTYTGPTVVTGTLNVAGSLTVTNAINAASGLVLNAGTLQFTGTPGSVNTQTFASTVLNRGLNGIVVTAANTANTMTLVLNGITRNAGAALNINSTSPTATITTTTANANYTSAGGQQSILGGWATFNGTSFATSAGTGTVAGAVTGLPNGSYNAGFAAGKDVDVQAGSSPAGGMAVNSIRYNAAGAADVTLSGGVTVASGGILVTGGVGNNPTALNGATVTAPAELYIHQYNNSGSASTFSIGSEITGAIDVIKTGPGKAALSNPGNSYSGKTYVLGGTLNVVSAGTATGPDSIILVNRSTLQLGAALNFGVNRGIRLEGHGGAVDTNGFDATIASVINGPGNFTKSGAGNLTLSGNNAYTGGTTVSGGTLTVTGVVTSLVEPNANTYSAATPTLMVIGSASNALGTLVVNGGTVTANRPSSVSLLVGGALGTGNGLGLVQVNGGLLTAGSELWLTPNNAQGGFAGMSVSGGTVTVGSYFVVGFNGNRASFEQTGGVVNVNNNFMTVGAGGSLSIAAANFSGGAFNALNGGLVVGENGYGQANISGAAQLSLGGRGLQSAPVNGAAGAANLWGGTVTTNRVELNNITTTASSTTRTSLLNFHGGTLRASTNSTNFIINSGSLSTNLASTYIWNEGGTLDDGGFTVTIGSAIGTPEGNGLSSLALGAGGSGYVSAPVISITGGGGRGATAVAGISGGVVTGLTITNPGVGYTAAPTIVIAGGGGTGATAGTSTLVTNVTPSAFLNKVGGGTLSLTSTNHTYTGVTNVNAGLLRILGPGSTSTSNSTVWMGPINVNGGGALYANGTLTQSVTVHDGGAFNLIDNAAGTVTLNAGLTAGGASGSLLLFDFAGSSNAAAGNDQINLNSTAFTVLGSVKVALNNLGSMATGSTYTLMTYGSNSNPAAVTFENGLMTTKIGFDTATLAVDNSKLIVSITGAAIPSQAWWTGTHGALWSTIGPGNQSNFNTAQSGGANTQKYPSVLTDVFFAATNPVATNLNTTLGANFTVKSLTVKGGSAPVTIEGTNQLAIAAGGITVEDTGSLTISAPVMIQASQSWNGINTGSLVVTGPVGGTTGSLTVLGTVVLGGANTFTGGVNIGSAATLRLASVTALGTGPLAFVPNSNGRLQVNGVVAEANGLNGDNTAVVEGYATNGALRVITSTASTSTFLGTIRDGDVGGNLGLTVLGSGTLTLGSVGTQAAVNQTGQIIVRSGVLNAVNVAINNQGGAPMIVSDTANTRGRLIVDNFTSITTRDNRASFQVGSTANAMGDVRMISGSISTPGAGEFWLGEEASTSSYAAMTMLGGAVNANQYLVVGFNGDRAVINQSGGAVTVGVNAATIAAGGSLSLGVYNMTGGNLTATGTGVGGVYVGENGTGILEVAGTATVSAAGNGVQLSRAGGSTGILNLRGGTIVTTRLFANNGTSTANFNGGRLIVSNNSTGTFMSGLNGAYVWSGGLAIESGGNPVAITSNLLAPTGNGLSAVNNTLAVTGYTNALNTPLVQITGGGGSGATGLANIDAAGNVTSITLTNPGAGYTSAPTISLLGGGFTQAGTNSSIAAPTLVANSSLTPGSLSKYGSGTVTLSGTNNTYAGATTVAEGTLFLAANARLVGAGQVTVGSNASFGGANNASVAGAVVVNGGSLTLRDGTVGTLTLGALTTLDGGFLAVEIGSATADLLTTGSLAVNSGSVKVDNIGLQPGKTYTIATFGSGNLAALTLDSGSTTIGLNTLSLVKNPTSLQVMVNGPALPTAAYWTGVLGDRWDSISGDNANFNTDATSGINTKQLPGAITDVYFASTSPAAQNLTNSLGTSMVVKSVNVMADTTVTINGTTNAFLIVEGVANAVSVESGGSLTLATPLVLNAVGGWGNQSANPIVVNGNISGPGGINLTAGKLMLNSTTNTFTGGVSVGAGAVVQLNTTGGLGSGVTAIASSGRVDVNASASSVGALSGTAGALVQNITGTVSTVTSLTTTATTWGGSIADSSLAGGITNFTLSAPTSADFGTLTLAASQPYTGVTSVSRGKLVLPAGVLLGSAATDTTLFIGNQAGKAVLELQPGASLARTGVNANPSVHLGSANGGNGVLIVGNNATLTASREFWVSTTDGGYGKLEVNGGTATLGNWMSVARGGGQGLVNLTSGLITVGSNIGLGDQTTANFVDNIKGQINVSGGTLLMTNTDPASGQIRVGQNSNGALNISANGVVITQVPRGIELSQAAGSAASPRTGILNLNGGTLSTSAIQVNNFGSVDATRRALVNFNGGTVLAVNPNQTPFFIGGFNSTASTQSGLFVYSGGANIDDGGNTITVASPLLAPAGNGLSAAGISISQTGGFVGEPLITVTGGGGYGATANAVLDGTGNLTGIVITSPGSGYTAMPTILVGQNGAGGGGSGTITGGSLVANSLAGGLTKLNSGTLLLTAAGSTYGGPTTIAGGAVVWNVAGATASGRVTGQGRAIVASGTTLTSDGVTAGSWQVEGTHVIRANAGTAGTSKVNAAEFLISGSVGAWTGKIDLNNNALILNAGSAAEQANVINQVKDQVNSGRAAGAWNGTGITSSTLATSSSFAAANTLAIADAGDLGLTAYAGQTGLTADSTIVTIAHNGDATLDGKVDAFDLNRLAANWQQSGRLWSSGDFTGDGKVDAFDLNQLAANWQFGAGVSLESALAAFPGLGDATAAVPEPASLAVLALGSAALLGRRRRRA